MILGRILPAIAWTVSARAQVQPYILFQIDTSGSMSGNLCGANIVDHTMDCPTWDDPCFPPSCDAESCGNGLPDDGRLWKVKGAVAEVVNSFGEASYALARFHQTSRGFNCSPVFDPQDVGGGWVGTCTGADILVPFAENNQQEILDWVDLCDNWPTSGDCDPSTNLAPNTGCSLCSDCGGGCDKELRPNGNTPIANSLVSDRVYIENVMGTDPMASCRPYVTILLTDGADSCSPSTDPPLRAAELCAIGVPVYVIGFASPWLEDELNTIADAGCGPGCDARGCRDTAIMVDNETDLALAFADIIQASVLVERCNGLDDDCDDLTDEDFPELGDACCDPCPGMIVCNPAGDATMCSGAGPCPEVCNSLDDNCNGLVDEDIDPPCAYETCNGVDDDGDGATDEDLPDLGQPCGVTIGECSMGLTCCDAGEFKCCGSTAPVTETCDCLDNNCNSQTDENVAQRCYGGPAAECPDPDSGSCNGICRPGGVDCVTSGCPSTPGPSCDGWLGPRAEDCNCLDDDCDTLTDEDPCADGAPCIDCACVQVCDPADEFPCPAGYLCRDRDGTFYCVPDPCYAVACPLGEVCDEATGACVNLCAGVTCAGTCCDGDCCEAWESCQDLDQDGAQTCDDTSCMNPASPCAEGEVCEDHVCVGDPCRGVECGVSRFCRDGTCHDLCPVCAPDERCVGGRCVDDPCAGQECVGAAVVCCDGECRHDACAAMTCGGGQYCDECAGACVDDPCTRTRCPEGYACLRGECLRHELSVVAVAASGAGGCACALGAPASSWWLGTILVLLVTAGWRRQATRPVCARRWSR